MDLQLAQEMILYLVINYKGKEFKKNIDTYVYMYDQITSLYT